MLNLVCHYPKMSWNQAQIRERTLLSSPPSSSSVGKISPSVLFIIIVLAVIFFVSGIIHLLVRFLTKHRSSSISESNRYPEMSGSEDFQRQLQQLFHLHDSGLDQAFIDALPVFLYKEIKGLKEPFDCPVCLCEFCEKDQLRLLPVCSHAFHIDCIDTWLLSNSTCPLCRGTLYTPGVAIENPVFDFDDLIEQDGSLGNGGNGVGQKSAENEIVGEKKLFSVRLGKFRSTNEEAGGCGGGGGGGGGGERVEGETSSSNLDARRCYSMGSYQYVVADLELQVALRPKRAGDSVRFVRGRGGQNGNSTNYSVGGGDAEGKKINSASKGESFSVSKIWMWPKKGKFPNSAETHVGNSSVTVGLPWTDRSQGT